MSEDHALIQKVAEMIDLGGVGYLCHGGGEDEKWEKSWRGEE